MVDVRVTATEGRVTGLWIHAKVEWVIGCSRRERKGPE
jgi:hypothetical protein